MNTYRVYLKAQNAAASAGPNFNIVPDVGVASPWQITKNELLSGIIITVDILATSLSLVSTGGACSSSFNVAIQKSPADCLPVGDPAYPIATPTPTATPSVTTTPTATPTATPSVTTTPTATPSVTTTPTATPTATPSVTTTPTATPATLIEDNFPTPCPPPPPPPSPTPSPAINWSFTGTGSHDPFFAIAKIDASSMDGSLSNSERFFAQWEDNGQNAINEMATIIYKNIDGTDIWVFHKNRFVPAIGGCVIQYVRVWANGVEHLYSAGNMVQKNTVVQYGPIILNMVELSNEVVSGGPYLELSISWESLPEGTESLSGGFGLVLKRASLYPNSYWQSTIGMSVDGFTEAGRPWGITRRHLEALAKLRPSSLSLPEQGFPMPIPSIDKDGDGIDEDLVDKLTDADLEQLLETSINTVDACLDTFNRLNNNNLPGTTSVVDRPDDPTPSYIIGRPKPSPTQGTLSAESGAPEVVTKSPISQRVQLYIDPLRFSS